MKGWRWRSRRTERGKNIQYKKYYDFTTTIGYFSLIFCIVDKTYSFVHWTFFTHVGLPFEDRTKILQMKSLQILYIYILTALNLAQFQTGKKNSKNMMSPNCNIVFCLYINKIQYFWPIVNILEDICVIFRNVWQFDIHFLTDQRMGY